MLSWMRLSSYGNQALLGGCWETDMALATTRLGWQLETGGQSAILGAENQAILGGQNSLLVLPYLGLPRIGNMRAYVAAHKLFCRHRIRQRNASLVFWLGFPFQRFGLSSLEEGFLLMSLL